MRNKKTKKIDVYEEVLNHVCNYKTEYEKGLTVDEMRDIYLFFEGKYKINRKKYDDCFMGNTCVIQDGRILTFRQDLIKALVCGIENRNLNGFEFD